MLGHEENHCPVSEKRRRSNTNFATVLSTHSIHYNGCRYKGQEFPVLKISAKIRVKAGNPVLNQSGIRVKEWDSVMIFAKILI